MPFYHKLGNIPHKRHTQHRHPDGQLYTEELFGFEGFSGCDSLLYHHNPPVRVVDLKPCGRDELEDRREGTGKETRYNLEMTAKVNGRELSQGNAKTLTHTFAAMIEWASTDVWLRPGDVLGSGTVGTGCILELRPENVGGWLKPGDVVELEIERLGVLRNRLVGSL